MKTYVKCDVCRAEGEPTESGFISPQYQMQNQMYGQRITLPPFGWEPVCGMTVCKVCADAVREFLAWMRAP